MGDSNDNMSIRLSVCDVISSISKFVASVGGMHRQFMWDWFFTILWFILLLTFPISRHPHRIVLMDQCG